MRKHFALLTIVGAAMLLSLAACQRVTYATAPEKGVFAGPVAGNAVGQFNLTRKAHFVFWGLKPVNIPNLADDAARGLQPGQALGNVRIEEVNSFVDGLLAYVTIGIYRPRTVNITGTIYQVK